MPIYLILSSAQSALRHKKYVAQVQEETMRVRMSVTKQNILIITGIRKDEDE
jgi:hypothetical protein